jgi:hypothetical protein
MNPAQVPATEIQPSHPAQETAARGVIARSPAITPIKKAERASICLPFSWRLGQLEVGRCVVLACIEQTLPETDPGA